MFDGKVKPETSFGWMEEKNLVQELDLEKEERVMMKFSSLFNLSLRNVSVI